MEDHSLLNALFLGSLYEVVVSFVFILVAQPMPRLLGAFSIVPNASKNLPSLSL